MPLCHGLTPAGDTEPRGGCIALPPAGKKKAKPVGWDKDDLTEQQR